ncbi:MAG TPA: S-methyl-5'-thioadenosine phosphorylase [Nitrososphaerales archaeon]
MEPEAEVGVFGGSGLYSMLEKFTEKTVETPYGIPGAKVAIGEVEGVKVAFIPRHGKEHQYPPHMIPVRANIWALHCLGVKRILGPCAAGSLQHHIKPGEFVICDQFINFTDGRIHTFYDGPETTHVSAADPYCADLRKLAIDTAKKLKIPVHGKGTVVVVEGPRFSTRAESKFFSSNGWEVINMTQYPECVLARELGLCYVNISLITDYDVGLEGHHDIKPVNLDEVSRIFHENNERVKDLIFKMIPKMVGETTCECSHALDSARIHL